MQIILASSSLARKKILASLGLDFKVIPSGIDETKTKLRWLKPAKTSFPSIRRRRTIASNHKLLVQKIAQAKAEAVAKRLKERKSQGAIALQVSPSFPSPLSSPSHHLILAADSMVVLGNKTIGKPKDKQEAKKILKALFGRTHQFITGLYVLNTKTKKAWQEVVSTEVTFRKLKDREIDEHIAKTDVTRYAGGYTIVPPHDFNLKTIKDGSGEIIAKINGSLTNVMGLPLEVLLPILRENEINC